MLNYFQWFNTDIYDEFEIAQYLLAIKNLLKSIKDYEFTRTGYNGHPWDAWESCGEYSPKQNYVNNRAALEMYIYSNSSWDNVADVVHIGDTLNNKNYTEEYLDIRKSRKYYRLTQDSILLLEESFSPIVVMFEERMKECEYNKQKESAQLLAIKNSIINCNTTVSTINDEGGKSYKYTHILSLKSGNILKFTERNVFDFGVVINPAYKIMPDSKESGGLYNYSDGRHVWMDFFKNEGWTEMREFTNDELIAMKYLWAYGGHAHCEMRI